MHFPWFYGIHGEAHGENIFKRLYMACSNDYDLFIVIGSFGFYVMIGIYCDMYLPYMGKHIVKCVQKFCT